jgi:hypothetical protein
VSTALSSAFLASARVLTSLEICQDVNSLYVDYLGY